MLTTYKIQESYSEQGRFFHSLVFNKQSKKRYPIENIARKFNKYKILKYKKAIAFMQWLLMFGHSEFTVAGLPLFLPKVKI